MELHRGSMRGLHRRRHIPTTLAALGAALILFDSGGAVAAAAPATLDYRLHLGRDAGKHGPVPLVFSAYLDSVGGAPVWEETHAPVPDADGNVRLPLGSKTPLSAILTTKPNFWLEIKVKDKVLPKRRKIDVTPVPFASTAADSARWNPIPPAKLADGRVRIALVDFGPVTHEAPHRIALGSEDRSPSLGWIDGQVRERTRNLTSGLYYCDLVEGHDATFVLAVDPPSGSYRVTLTMGDSMSPRTPAEVLVGGKVVTVSPATKAGQFATITFNVPAEGGRLKLRIRGRDCETWALVGLDLYGPAGARLTTPFDFKKPPDLVPPPAKLAALGKADPREVLRSYCRFLMEERLHDGTFSYRGAWYANAYPIRTLLAGSILLNEPSWRGAAFECLDRFVDVQREDGNWNSSYFGARGCRPEESEERSSANLADIGSMSLCLAIAAPLADKPRQERYLRAAMRYADRIVLPAQLPSGAFANGLYQGKVYAHPYSVATANQASSLVALGAATGNAKYKKAGERAALWIAGQFREDGTVRFAPHDAAEARLLPPNAFGDLFYLVEALTFMERYAGEGDARSAARLALEHYVWGARGLKSTTENGYWWKPRDLWSDSKMGGVLYLLTEVNAWCYPGALGNWIPEALAWLADPALSVQIGVTAPLPTKTSLYGMAATGFAGIGVANLINPRVLAINDPMGMGIGPSARAAPRSD